MSESRAWAFPIGLAALVIAFFIGFVKVVDEDLRKERAHEARRCSVLLAFADSRSDSLQVLQDGCARAITADTMP